MATKEGGNSIYDFAQRICKHGLERNQFVEAFKKFLSKVDLPDGWPGGKDYKLQDIHPTYKYRHNCLRKFVEQKEAKGIKVAADQLKGFIEELENAASSPIEVESSFSPPQEQKSQFFDVFFEQNIKLEGVVVRKIEKRASILTKIPDQFNRERFILNELVINLQDGEKSGLEFHLNVGDIVELTKCRRKEGLVTDADIIKCLSRTESEMESFLEHLVNCLRSEGSTAAVTELTRCQAFWNYILEKCNPSMVPQILEITDQICSFAQMQMSHTVRRIVEGLQSSAFFKSVLPTFIHSMTKENSNRVQRVLEHVMKVCPDCGPILLPMAMDLAHNLVHNSSDIETTTEDFHTGCHSAVEFLGKLSSIIAVEVPGAREDLKAVHWRKRPLIPVTRELREPEYLKVDELPSVRKEGSYPSEEEYLNIYFELLREECFYKLRKGIIDFVMKGSQFDSKDMMMHRIVLKGVSTLHEHHPSVMSFALKYTALHSKDDTELDPSSWFMYGSLLCISMDDSFKEPVWATVEKHVAKDGIVWVTLCGGGANVINEAEFIIKIQEITDRNDKAFMAESQTFYLSFGPAMDVLQHKDCVPFKEFIVGPDQKADLKPADYIFQIKQQPDWRIIFENENLPDHSNHQGELSDFSLLNEFEQKRLNSHYKPQLDETQLTAVELALNKKLALIQGPPGTGKSFVGVALVRLLLSMNVPQDHGPILVITYKNHALDHFLEECLKNVPSHKAKIVRVGRLAEGASMELENCLLSKVGYRWPDVLFKQKRKLTGQLWAMQPQMMETSRKLRESCIFRAETFLKEASNDQIKYLLVDNKQKTVDEAEVEALLYSPDQANRSKIRLRELVENALKDWLPSQEEFDSFACEEKRSQNESVTADTAAKSKEGSKEPKIEGDQEQENPNDLREPAAEQDERLLAVDEEPPDNEDEEIMKDEASVLQDSRQKVDKLRTRKLVCIDDTKVRPFRNLLNAAKVWDLRPDERAKLAYVFQSSYREKASKEFLAVSQAYVQVHHQLQELKNQHNIEVMKSCHVIGMTVTGATMRANLLADIKPSVMIVEEAAEILEGQLVAVIPPSVQHLIMIGDHKQLRPLVHYQKLKRRNFDLSMFERLINCQLPYRQLKFQCRMRDEFVDLLRKLNIYPELNTNEELVRENVPPHCVEKSMYFWTHTEGESDLKNSHSKVNKAEAEKITKVAEELCGEGQVPPSKITVLCSYRGQVTEITNRFTRSKIKAALQNIAVSTIDSFQGQENDIILISLVRSKGAKIGHLSSLNRLCVAISRARCGLYLFGNHVHLAKLSKKGWKIVSDAMRDKKCLGRTFPFRSSGQFLSKRETEDQSEDRGPVNVINSKNVIVNIGDKSVNTITDSTAERNEPSMDQAGNTPSSITPYQHMDMPFSPSDKIPEHNPKSPPPGAGFSHPRVKGSDVDAADANLSCVPAETSQPEGSAIVEREFESTKEAKTSTQETSEPTKSHDDIAATEGFTEPPDKEARTPTQESKEVETSSLSLSEFENLKERPTQESEDPKNSVVDTPAVEDEFKKETPVQKSEKEINEGLKDHPGKRLRHVYQKGDLKEMVKNQPSQVTGEPSDKRPESEDQREGRGGLPLQETEGPGKGHGTDGEGTKQEEHEELSEGKPLQESASSNAETESWKALPTQETMPAGKGPFEETGDAQETVTQGTRHIEEKEANEQRCVEVETESCMDETLPTQETMPAGKGPFEETGDAQKTAAEETRQVKEEGEVYGEFTEGKTDMEITSVEEKTEGCTGENLPTQETVAADKGPFE